MDNRRRPPAADPKSSERLEKRTDVPQAGVRLRSQSFIEDRRVWPKTNAKVFPTDRTGHPMAAQLEPMREWNPYNEKKAVSLIQRHFNRQKDPVWPDLMNGNEASKVIRAKGVINRIISRATKIDYEPDRRGNMCARYMMHGSDQSKVGPGIENTGSGVMYDSRGMIHLIDRRRAPEVLEADQARHAAEMAAHRAKKESQRATDASAQIEDKK